METRAMHKIVAIAAAAGLLMSSVAFSQTNPPPAPGDAPPPPAEQAAPAGDMPQADRHQRREARERRRERRERREARRDEGNKRDHGMRGHGGPGYRHGMGGPQQTGAVFRFNGGAGGASFTIRCAVQDTTQECVSAMLPLLDRVIPSAGQASAGQ
jgi:hypothetical protein